VAASFDHAARTVAHQSKAVAEAAHRAYEEALPAEQRSFASIGRVPPVTAGEPARPVREAVAAIGVANTGAALALEVGLGSVDDAYLERLINAAMAVRSAGTRGIDLLHHPSVPTARLVLAHDAARACYEIDAALAASPQLRNQSIGAHLGSRDERLPAWWRAIADPLVDRLVNSDTRERSAARIAAGAAHDAAEQLMRTYEAARRTNACSSALLRCARGAALAAAYAAWSALSAIPQSSAASESRVSPRPV
jgi:hypothetical protein